MRTYFQSHFSSRLLLLILITLPAVLLFLLPEGGIAGALWFWLLALLTIVALWIMIGRPAETDPAAAALQPQAIDVGDQPESVRRIMDVDDAIEDPSGVRVFRGKLNDDAEHALATLKNDLGPAAVPLIQPGPEGRTTVVLLPRAVEEQTMEFKVRPWLHWLLFGLTVVTTTFAGAAHQGVNLLRTPDQFAVGLPYSLALLAILGVHELGHYFTARYYGIRVTPPFFIPVPFALGTFGAFIQMRSPVENRRALFDVAVAGPLAGLVIALLALYLGLRTSEIVPAASVAQGTHGMMSQASILMALVIDASLGGAMAAGDALRLSPLAFAGWLGLLVTALNLIPVGQLDGGHIARALLGTRAGTVLSTAAMFTLLLLAVFVWPGLLMWAIIVFFLAGRGAPPLNDVTPLSTPRKVLAVLAFIVLAIIIVPMPEAVSAAQAQSMRCPYL